MGRLGIVYWMHPETKRLLRQNFVPVFRQVDEKTVSTSLQGLKPLSKTALAPGLPGRAGTQTARKRPGLLKTEDTAGTACRAPTRNTDRAAGHKMHKSRGSFRMRGLFEFDELLDHVFVAADGRTPVDVDGGGAVDAQRDALIAVGFHRFFGGIGSKTGLE